MKTKFESCKKDYIKGKKNYRVNKLSLSAWIMAMLVAIVFWVGIFQAFESGFVAQSIAKLHQTALNYLAKR